jgi:putative selenate reductase molybdopterin-binding subunit
VIDAEGRVANPTFRSYHIPAFADAPQTEVHFAKTFDRIGPLGAKSMSESPYNPVAAALANAIRDATGVRLYETPFLADELYRAVVDRDAAMPNAKRLPDAPVQRQSSDHLAQS